MKKLLLIILATLVLGLLWAGISAMSCYFNDVVEIEPHRIVLQCDLPPDLEVHMVSALHDIDSGRVQVKLDAAPSDINLHKIFTQHAWRFNHSDQSYCNSHLKVFVNEQDCTLLIE
ncbi:MAG: hypothetical protein R3Y56_09825 [Akkermansia sp.]